jgi:hypothetical protein
MYDWGQSVFGTSRKVAGVKLPLKGSHADQLLRDLAAIPGGRIEGPSGYSPYAEQLLVKMGFVARNPFGSERAIWLKEGVIEKLRTIPGDDAFEIYQPPAPEDGSAHGPHLDLEPGAMTFVLAAITIYDALS